MRVAWIIAITIALLVLMAPTRPAAAASCQFVLGFKALHDVLPAIVGDCRVDEHHNPQNGDGLQETSKGLLVWRKVDNWTAFTDGYRTWINGPTGLQERLNSQRFPWEADAAQFPAAIPLSDTVTGSPPAAVSPAAMPAQPAQSAAPAVWVTAWVSNPSPKSNSTETVSAELLDASAHGIPGTTMHAVWNDPAAPFSCDGGPAGANGIVSCSRQMSHATIGLNVEVDVTLTLNGQTYTATTSFIPQ